MSYTLLLMQAAQTSAQGPPQKHWIDILTAVVGLPGLVIAAAYSAILIQKTRVEILKTELEIEEKRRALKFGNQDDASDVRHTGQLATESGQRVIINAAPGAEQNISLHFNEDRPLIFIVLRFILLYLLIQLWWVVSRWLNLIVTGILVGVLSLFRIDPRTFFDGLPKWLSIPVGLIAEYYREVCEWILLVLLGLPLVRDLNRALGISMKAFWKLPERDQPDHTSAAKHPDR